MLNTTQKRSKSIVIVFGNIRFSLDPRIGLVQMHFLEQFYFANARPGKYYYIIAKIISLHPLVGLFTERYTDMIGT